MPLSARSETALTIAAVIRVRFPFVSRHRSVDPVESSWQLCPLWADQVLVSVQAYKFAPAGASVLKKSSPVAQAAGSDVPVLRGLVDKAAEKSTFRAWVRKST